jgi:hypothetical protein
MEFKDKTGVYMLPSSSKRLAMVVGAAAISCITNIIATTPPATLLLPPSMASYSYYLSPSQWLLVLCFLLSALVVFAWFALLPMQGCLILLIGGRRTGLFHQHVPTPIF